MRIELVGCTGAGKTTLARDMVMHGQMRGIDIVQVDMLVMNLLHVQWVKVRFLQKLVVNCAGLIASVLTWRTNGELYRFAFRMLQEAPISRFERVALMRNVLKKVGLSELARSAGGNGRIVVLDEGALHIAHNLFVHTAAETSTALLPEFVKLVSLPDIVVYVQEEERTLIERVMQCGHPRITEPSQEIVARFIRQATKTFERVVEEPAVRRRLVVVNGGKKDLTPAGAISAPDPASILAAVRSLGQSYVA